MAIMTGKQLLAKLADAGSGESKLKACADAMPGDSALDVVRTLKNLGYQATAEKAAAILTAEGIAVPSLEVSADSGLRAALDESKAMNAKLIAENRELKAQLAAANVDKGGLKETKGNDTPTANPSGKK